MEWRSQKLLIVAGVAAVAAIPLVFGRSSASFTSTVFFQRRASIYAELQRRIQDTPLGVKILLPPTDEVRQREIAYADESHVRSVTKREEWNSTGTFTLLLDLDERAVPPGEQGSSQTMAAAKLSTHYFGGLIRVGLVSQSRNDTVGVLQMSSGGWSSADDLFFLEGTVFVSPAEKRAIVKCVIRERLPKQ